MFRSWLKYTGKFETSKFIPIFTPGNGAGLKCDKKMMNLKITDNSNGEMEIILDNVMVDGEDVIGVLFAQKWGGVETFVNITNIEEVDEVIRWLQIIKEKMVLTK